MWVLIRTLGFFVLFVSLALVSPGATITGSLKGSDGAPFEGAFVQVQNTNTKITVNVLSNKDGRYRVENLPAGEYDLRIRAIGYKSEPQRAVSLAADQISSFDFALQKGMVRWSDLSYYQGIHLFPDAPAKKEYVGTCFGCHGFQTRMAPVRRNEEGWRDRVNYMRELTHSATAPFLTEQKANDIAAYINSLFGEDSVLPRSPADMPEYKGLVRHFGDEAMSIVYVEYDMRGPSQMPWDANPAKDGSVWIANYGGTNAIDRLDPKTGEMKEFKLPTQGPAFIHSAWEARDGNVWFVEQAPNKIGKWDPKTQEITEYQDAFIPGKEGLRSGGSKHTIRIDSKGIVWTSGTPFGSFDPGTRKFTEYPVAPNKGDRSITWMTGIQTSDTYGLEIDKDDNVWVTGFTPDGKLYKKDGKTGKITGYSPPTAGLPRQIAADTDGTIWFGEYAAGKLGHFDPRTNTFKEFSLPGPDASPYALGIDKDHHIWYSSEQMDVVGRLDPNSGQVTEYPFPQSENTMREFIPDSEGRMWFASPANNKVGYFYLADRKP
jgi:virginiamycin B lyase